MKKAVCAEKVARNILRERMDLPAEAAASIEVRVENDHYHLQLDGKQMLLPNVFFANAAKNWLAKDTLPKLPLTEFTNPDLHHHNFPIPILFGQEEPVQSQDQLSVDIFGSIYFLLSRYEEAVPGEKDNHERFSATTSIAYKCGFLQRPLADEYRDLFWAYFQKIWPNVAREQRTPRTIISCDVDWPKDPAGSSFYYSARKALGRVVKEGSIRKAWDVLSNYQSTSRGSLARDPFHQGIHWMMDVNEKAGNQATFNILPEQTNPKLDNPYRIDSPEMRKLIRTIHERGHLIGFHPGYETFDHPGNFKASADLFWKVVESENIKQDEFGGRQHFLRWKHPQTAKLWETNGFAYDSTLGFADQAGFRCGTSREYTMFGLEEENWLMQLREQPLVLMECTVMAQRYMGLGQSEQALEYMQNLQNICKRHGGDFTLLWHNTEVATPQEREIYLQLI